MAKKKSNNGQSASKKSPVRSSQVTDATAMPAREVLHEGRFLRLVKVGRWEFAERTNARGAVAVVAVTGEDEFVLTEQMRFPVGKIVIDLPAGLSGDEPGQDGEDFAVSALRELVEETGFHAKRLTHLADCPSSPGMVSEVISYYLASNITRQSAGGGVAHEAIVVRTPKLKMIKSWLAKQVAAGKLIDGKVYAGLHFLSQRRGQS